MKWNRNWLVKQKNGKFDFEETITFPKEMFYNLSRINDLKDVEVTGSGNFNSSEERLYVTYHVQGTMVVPCAISLEDVDYPFSIDTDVVFAFYKPDEDEDVVEARKRSSRKRRGYNRSPFSKTQRLFQGSGIRR